MEQLLRVLKIVQYVCGGALLVMILIFGFVFMYEYNKYHKTTAVQSRIVKVETKIAENMDGEESTKYVFDLEISDNSGTRPLTLKPHSSGTNFENLKAGDSLPLRLYSDGIYKVDIFPENWVLTFFAGIVMFVVGIIPFLLFFALFLVRFVVKRADAINK